VRDETNSVDLGSDLSVAASGVRSFAIANPTTDAKVSVRIKKDIFGGVSPIIFGIVLHYST
jgi:hypothetical protein